MGIPLRDLIYDVCGGIPNGQQAQGGHPGRHARCRRSTPASSTCRCEFDALMTDARIKDVEVRPGVPFDLGGGRKLQDHGRLGRHRRVRRQHRRGRALRAHHAVLRARVVRPVHALPRGHRLAGARLQAPGARRRAGPATSSSWPTSRNGIGGNTICALGDAAAWPMLGFLTKFRADFEARIKPQDRSASPAAIRGGGQGRGGVSSCAAERRPSTVPTRSSSGLLAAHDRRLRASSPSPARTRSRRSCRWWPPSSGWPRCTPSLSAHFLAVLQVLVYAGAIMVLFIFVVMILNREEVTPLSFRPAARARASLAGRLPVRQVRRRGRASHARRHPPSAVGRPSAPSPRSATSCSATTSTPSRRSRCCCWSPSSAASWSRARTRKRSPPSAPPSTASRSRSWPATTTRARPTTPPRREGHHYRHADHLLPDPVVRAVPDRDARRAPAPQRAHRAHGRSSCSSTAATWRCSPSRAQLNDLKGHVFAFLIIALAAAEAAVGLAILVGLFRSRADRQPRRNHADEALSGDDAA